VSISGKRNEQHRNILKNFVKYERKNLKYKFKKSIYEALLICLEKALKNNNSRYLGEKENLIRFRVRNSNLNEKIVEI
jgi:hypothetical protein